MNFLYKIVLKVINNMISIMLKKTLISLSLTTCIKNVLDQILTGP